MFKLIIADDEAITREGLRNSVKWKELGLEVVACAENGVQALEAFRQNPADIILTDIRMPFMDGLELIEKIKELKPSATIILLSAYDDFKYAQKAIRLGAFDYILKPIDIDILEETVKKSIDYMKKHTGKKKEETTIEGSTHKNRKLVEEVLKIIENNYSSKELSLNMIAEKLYITPNYLSSLFKEDIGEGFTDYLSRYRVDRAKELLKDVKLKVYEVSDAVGYTDSQYFSKIFKGYTGLTPKEYREKTI